MLLFGPEVVPALFLALLLDLLLGDPPWLWGRVPHPVVWVGRAVAWFERRWQPGRNEPRLDRAAGALLVAVLVVGTFLAGLPVHLLAGEGAGGVLMTGLVAFPLFAWRSLVEHVRAVEQALRRSLPEARLAVSHIVGRDTSMMDRHAVARAAVESLAENFSDGVVAPWFWMLLFGLPGLFVYKTVNTLDSMIGYTTPRHRHFGLVAARLDDVMNWIPARLSAVLIVLATLFVPDARPGPAVRVIRRDARRHRSPNAGWPEAAVAGALGLRLSGPRVYHGIVAVEPWIGEGRRELEPEDIDRALRLVGTAQVLLLAITAALALR
ncbi:Cobalamin biosynthesis protein CobD [bacterium HR39]|nr:Cobalamin biosynthesis protein CobD [bacterium HR39]